MKLGETEEVLSTTESLCPVCLRRIPAQRLAAGDDVYLAKSCPDHGGFRTIIWRGQPAYHSWAVTKLPSQPPVCAQPAEKGCPFDCGLCPDHRQHTCCVLLEVTQRCNLNCPVCFAFAGGDHTREDPDLKTVENWYRLLLASGGPYNIQLSGGEPTLRDDLPNIIALGRSLGFTFFQLNTNGLRLAREPGYAERLKQAGLDCVFLQFDGTSDRVYETMRGKALLDVKKAAVDNCARQQLGVVLVPTLAPGVNRLDIGGILQLALSLMPTVRGVHFQPVSYFGRYPQPPSDKERITIPEVLRAIEEQTGGRMKAEDFHPPGAENSYCSFSAHYVVMADGELKALSRRQACCCPPQPAAEGARKAQAFVARHWAGSCCSQAAGADEERASEDCAMNLDSLDVFLKRVGEFSFCVSGMAFQDVWNLELERLRDCFIHVVSPDARIIPFCAYNLTDREGRPLYRPGWQLPQPS